MVAAQIILHLAQCAGEGVLCAIGLQAAGQRHSQHQHTGRTRNADALRNHRFQTVFGLYNAHTAAGGVQHRNRRHLVQRLQRGRVQQAHAGVRQRNAVKKLRQSVHFRLQLGKGVFLFHVVSFCRFAA